MCRWSRESRKKPLLSTERRRRNKSGWTRFVEQTRNKLHKPKQPLDIECFICLDSIRLFKTSYGTPDIVP